MLQYFYVKRIEQQTTPEKSSVLHNKGIKKNRNTHSHKVKNNLKNTQIELD